MNPILRIVIGVLVPCMLAGCVRRTSELDAGLVARVVTVSAVPDPADAPYEDCLTHLKLEAINRAGGFEPGDSLIVVAWGFRDRVLAEAAVLRPGDSILVKPVAFEAVEETYRHTMRVDDTDDFESALYWAEKIGFVDSETRRRVQVSLGKVMSILDQLGGRRSAVERILRILEAHDGMKTGLFYGKFVFIEYEYLYTDEYLTPAGERIDSFHVSPLDAILEFKRLLDSYGIELVVIFPPRSAAIFPDFATSVFWDHAVNGRVDLSFLEFIKKLRSEGVEVVDVVPDFLANRYEKGPEGVEFPVYLRRDPHWSSGGAERAARLVAQAVRRQDWFESYAREAEHEEFQYEAQVGVDSMKNPWAEYENGDERIPVILHRVEPEPGFESYVNPTDMSAPVQLIGDSFAWHKIDRDASFYDHLVAQVRTPIGMTAMAGGATTTALTQWLRRGNPETTRVVVWEIVASALAHPDQWRRTAPREEPALDLVVTYDPARSSGELLVAIRDERTVPVLEFTSRPLMSLMVRREPGAAPPLVQRSNWKNVKLGGAARFRCRVKNLPMNFEDQGSVSYEVLIDGVVIARRVVDEAIAILWRDWEVDLSAFAHRVVEFSLQTEINHDGARRPGAGWGDPEILDAQILNDAAKSDMAGDPS